MKLIFTFLCAGAVLFMLRFAIALVKEARRRPPQPLKIYFAKFKPSMRRGETDSYEFQE